MNQKIWTTSNRLRGKNYQYLSVQNFLGLSMRPFFPPDIRQDPLWNEGLLSCYLSRQIREFFMAIFYMESQGKVRVMFLLFITWLKEEKLWFLWITSREEGWMGDKMAIEGQRKTCFWGYFWGLPVSFSWKYSTQNTTWITFSEPQWQH